MIRSLLQFFVLFIVLLYSIDTKATKFVAIANGNWGDTNTWDQNAIPTSSDTVYIDGFTVTVIKPY